MVIQREIKRRLYAPSHVGVLNNFNYNLTSVDLYRKAIHIVDDLSLATHPKDFWRKLHTSLCGRVEEVK